MLSRRAILQCANGVAIAAAAVAAGTDASSTSNSVTIGSARGDEGNYVPVVGRARQLLQLLDLRSSLLVDLDSKAEAKSTNIGSKKRGGASKGSDSSSYSSGSGSDSEEDGVVSSDYMSLSPAERLFLRGSFASELRSIAWLPVLCAAPNPLLPWRQGQLRPVAAPIETRPRDDMVSIDQQNF